MLEQETAVEAIGPGKLWRSSHPDPKGVEEVASLILKSKSPAIIASDDVARSGATEALVKFTETIGASVWFEGLRHHASFPTGHPSFRQSLPPDAAQVRKALEAPISSFCWAGHSSRTSGMRKEAIFLQVRLVVQIEESPERLAFNHRLDGGIVGEMSASIASLTDAVRSRASEEFQLAAQRRNQALAELSARDKEAYRARLEKSLEPRAKLDAARDGGTQTRAAR